MAKKTAKTASASARATADREVVITHPEKILFPDDGITKGDLATYYETVAPLMLPHVQGRPITMERYPAGIGKKGFWQKSVEKGFPKWLERVDVPKKDGVVHHPVITDARSLMWLANQNTITCHVWTSRVPELCYPDICVFDLDPSSTDPAPVRAAAIGLRDFSRNSGRRRVKASGSKGYHIVVPLDGKANMAEAERFANQAGRLFVSHARSPHAGVQQGRSQGPHLRGYRSQRLQRDVRRGARPREPARRCRPPARGRRSSAAGESRYLHDSHLPARLKKVRRHLGRYVAQPPIVESRDRKLKRLL